MIGGRLVGVVAAVAGLAWAAPATAQCSGKAPAAPACQRTVCLEGVWQRVPLAAGTPCNDGSACTTGDVCDGQGTCRGAAVTCASLGPCRTNTCVAGVCTAGNQPAGISCNDGNACTYGDACDGVGACRGTAIACVPASPCQASGCNGTATCSIGWQMAGTPCSDGNACTYGDACDAGGACRGLPVACVASGPCDEVICNGTAACTTARRPAGTSCPAPANPCEAVCDGQSVLCQPQ